MHMVNSVKLVLGYFAIATAFSLPPPTGPYHVGITQYVLNHTTPNDPFAPNNIGTSVLLNFYYPTLQVPNTTRPYLDLGLAEYYEAYFPLPAGFLSNITTNLQFQAPPLPKSECKHLPTLLFGPPFAGPPSQGFTSLLSDLASHGYTVATIDHPYEQPFLQYPFGGPGIEGLAVDYEPTFEEIESTHAYRLTDTVAFFEAFPRLVKQFKASFNTTDYILFGHSLGGSAALGSLLELKEPNILGAINLDGSIMGDAANGDPSISDTKKPTLLMASEGHDESIDPSWYNFTRAQSNWWRELSVNGTGHSDYSDSILWKQWAGISQPGPDVISADRMVALVRAHVGAFFGMLLGEDASILQAPSPEWPEVVFAQGSNTTYAS